MVEITMKIQWPNNKLHDLQAAGSNFEASWGNNIKPQDVDLADILSLWFSGELESFGPVVTEYTVREG